MFCIQLALPKETDKTRRCSPPLRALRTQSKDRCETGVTTIDLGSQLHVHPPPSTWVTLWSLFIILPPSRLWSHETNLWFETLWIMWFYKLVGFSGLQLSTSHIRQAGGKQHQQHNSGTNTDIQLQRRPRRKTPTGNCAPLTPQSF